MTAAHRRIVARLSQYLDGELTATERDRVEAHLQDCATCSAELQRLYALDSSLRQLGSVDAEYAVTRAALARFRLRLRDEPAPLPPFYGAPAALRPTPRFTPRALLPALSLALVLFIAAMLTSQTDQPTPGSTVGWSTFAGHLDSPQAPIFRIEYPSGWSLSQVKFSAPLLASLRFSNYRPPLADNLSSQPGLGDAEVWVAFGPGSLQKGWPADEVAELTARGYISRQVNLAGYTALRLTDTSPHFGNYDSVYVPIGSDFTLRVYLSTANADYEPVFDRMLASLELGGK